MATGRQEMHLLKFGGNPVLTPIPQLHNLHMHTKGLVCQPTPMDMPGEETCIHTEVCVAVRSRFCRKGKKPHMLTELYLSSLLVHLVCSAQLQPKNISKLMQRRLGKMHHQSIQPCIIHTFLKASEWNEPMPSFCHLIKQNKHYLFP